MVLDYRDIDATFLATSLHVSGPTTRQGEDFTGHFQTARDPHAVRVLTNGFPIEV